MALSQSAVSELLEAFRAGDGADLIRESVRIVLQELIETEAAQVVGTQRYERTPTRTTQHNGGRARVLSTQAGDVSLRIPKLRRGPAELQAMAPMVVVVAFGWPGATASRTRIDSGH